MSFGISVGDFVLLTQLAWKIVQNSKQACGAHDELIREVTSLHLVLQRLQREATNPASIISRINDGRAEELRTIVGGCNRQLKVLDQVLTKYNGLSEEKRKTTKLWQKVKFGNGEMKDLEKIRQELATHTAALTLFLNLLSMGSQGRVEEHMENHSAEMRNLRSSINWITASLQASDRSNNREGSILTSYGDDDKKIWKEFRRELIEEGFSSGILRRNKNIIKEYVMELGARGALDEPPTEEPQDNEDFAETKEHEDTVQSDSDSDSAANNLEEVAPHLCTTAEEGISEPNSRRSPSRVSIEMEKAILRFKNSTSNTRNKTQAARPANINFASTTSNSNTTSRIGSSQLKLNEPKILRSTMDESKFVSIEEIEDEDFKPGAHPNCVSDEESIEQSDVEVVEVTDDDSQEAQPAISKPLQPVDGEESDDLDYCTYRDNEKQVAFESTMDEEILQPGRGDHVDQNISSLEASKIVTSELGSEIMVSSSTSNDRENNIGQERNGLNFLRPRAPSRPRRSIPYAAQTKSKYGPPINAPAQNTAAPNISKSSAGFLEWMRGKPTKRSVQQSRGRGFNPNIPGGDEPQAKTAASYTVGKEGVSVNKSHRFDPKRLDDEAQASSGANYINDRKSTLASSVPSDGDIESNNPGDSCKQNVANSSEIQAKSDDLHNDDLAGQDMYAAGAKANDEGPLKPKWDNHRQLAAEYMRASSRRSKAVNGDRLTPIWDENKAYAAQYMEATRQKSPIEEIPLKPRWDKHKGYAADYMRAARQKPDPINVSLHKPNWKWDDDKNYAAEYMRAARQRPEPIDVSPLEPKWDDHKDLAAEYMRAARRDPISNKDVEYTIERKAPLGFLPRTIRPKAREYQTTEPRGQAGVDKKSDRRSRRVARADDTAGAEDSDGKYGPYFGEVK